MGRRSRRCWPGKVPSAKSKKHYDPPRDKGGQLHPQRMTSFMSHPSFHFLPFLLLRLPMGLWHTSPPSPRTLSTGGCRGILLEELWAPLPTHRADLHAGLWSLGSPWTAPAGLSPNSTHGASPQGLRVSAELVSRPRCSLALGCPSSLVFVFLSLR